ncbi:hypothetical protein FA10DRAFT_277909 [Acaromyces ingoldii]|uniref:Uncharacterized protein n=1 Tax=Acaromyces ingoldii TaxID=215250 RepID=A0A316YY20_9BASI|nr:hypothetical protein FA10DRAFT_277909 [Acaromyces ingoldii]PWN94347.1 hypothetical protein FA10DRAFT_277909 [Acaromyces ingoldii]
MQETVAMPVAGSSNRGKDRDSRIQSAKKKLKSYQAKQAQAEKAKRISMNYTGGSAGPSRQQRSSSPTSIVGNVIENAARQSNGHLFASDVGESAGSRPSSAGDVSQVQQQQHSRRHSRTSSRAGHGRGHSRTGSISFSQTALAQATFTAAVAANTGLAENSTAPATRHSTSFVANTATSHTRGHSRSGSRSATGRARPVSFFGGAKHEIKVSLIDESLFGGKPKEAKIDADEAARGDWDDVDAQIEDECLKTPTMAQPSAFQTAPSTPADAIVDTSNDITPQQPKAHARRASRHTRKSSVATKRESMEIMGGLGLLAAMSQAPSSDSLSSSANRRRSSNRFSGLQSASVLFGNSPLASSSDIAADRRSGVRLSHQRQPSGINSDWRSALQAARENDNDDERLTALEKLEGRRPSSSSPGQHRETRSDLNDRRHSRQSSVQLPSFDDVHGPDGMDKRASLNLLESNMASTSSERPSSIIGARGLAPPVASGGVAAAVALGGGTSPSLPSESPAVTASAESTATSARPQSMFLSGDQLEGLGTLLEEEEEEEEGASMSPVKEKASFMDQERKRQKEAEQEAVKRSRRASLTPRPLKLKSRPASLFMGSQLGTMTPSMSLPTMSASSSSQEESEPEKSADSEASIASSEPDRARISSNHATLDSNAGAPWSLSSAQQKLADARASPSPKDLPSIDTKRSWRSSMPAPPRGMSSAISSASSVPSATNQPTSSTPPRQGMRALRLGSSGLSTSTSAADLERSAAQHPVPNDSISSEASTKSASTNSASNRRGSIIYNPAPNMPSPLAVSREDLGHGVPSSSPVISSNASGVTGMRRSSIHYKAASPSTPTKTNAPGSAPAETVGTNSPAPSYFPPQSAPASSAAAGGGVPMPMFEELKSKHQRDVALLDDVRKEVARLNREMAHETERSTREYTELERWSAEEKRGLGTRIEHLETAIAEIVAVRDAREDAFKEEREKVEEELRQKAEKLEDAEAERDMLQDDVEGWRTRCGDLEKSSQKDRAVLDEEKRLRANAQSKVKELLDLVDQHGIAPPRPRQEYAADDVSYADFPMDLVSALRSPALGGASPSANAGYFSPKIPQHDGAASLPPPQAVKLLKDMRQQIFNLAGSLEHERSEHLKAKEEADALRAENARLASSFQDASGVNSTFNTTISSGGDSPLRRDGGAYKGEDSTFDDVNGGMSCSTTLSSLTSTPPKTTPTKDANVQRSSSGSGMVGKNRKHVFAYDSSMGSASFGSGSVGTNLSSGLTSEHDHHHQHNEHDSSSQKGSQDHLTGAMDVLDGVAASEADLVGLGVSKLQTLDEEEEATTEAETPGSNAPTPVPYAQDRVQTVEDSARDSFDLEAGADIDVESIAPSTPALDRRDEAEQGGALPVVAISGEMSEAGHSKSSTQSSASSSAESHGPVSPYASGEDEQRESRFNDDGLDTFDSALWCGDDHFVEDYLDEEADEAGSVARPEFIREWSFQKASEAIRAKRAKAAEYRRARVEAARKGLEHRRQEEERQRKKRRPSIDDFFGIMKLDESMSLPALPTPDEALDMPPVYIDQHRADSQRFSAGSNYDNSPRMSMRIDGPAYSYHPQHQHQQQRPPVAKSAYVAATRDSGNYRPMSSSSLAQDGGRFSQDYYQQQQQQQLQQQQQQPASVQEQQVAAAAAAAAGGGMLSRVSLSGLTSAFSGLGGYLLSGQGNAVNMAAAATKACTRSDDPENHYHNEDGGSISWTATRRLEEA